MKKFQLLVCILLITTVSFSQEKPAKLEKLYTELGAGSASDNAFSSLVGLQAIFPGRWTLGLSYHYAEPDPHNLPADYKPAVIFFISEGNPNVALKTFSLTGGRYFPAGRKLWFTTSAGISVVSGKEFHFTPNPTRGGVSILGSSSNYTTTEETKTAMGALLKADLNWGLLSFLGLGAGVFADVNGLQSSTGFQLRLLLGKMNIGRR